MRLCSVADCENKHSGRGFCQNHWQQKKRKGNFPDILQKYTHPEKCTFADCENKYLSRGFCDRHYRQLIRYGEPRRTTMDFSETERFNSKFKINTETGCHEWTDSVCKWGYGMFKLKKSLPMKAHRYAYLKAHGEIPKGKFICHHCDNPKCVNVDHLFSGTALENNLDKIKKNRHNNPKGEGHFRCVSKTEIVIQVKTCLKTEKSPTKIARNLNLPVNFVENIKRQRTWKHVQI